MATTQIFKKIIALALSFVLVLGIAPAQPTAALASEVTFVSSIVHANDECLTCVEGTCQLFMPFAGGNPDDGPETGDPGGPGDGGSPIDPNDPYDPNNPDNPDDGPELPVCPCGGTCADCSNDPPVLPIDGELVIYAAIYANGEFEPYLGFTIRVTADGIAHDAVVTTGGAWGSPGVAIRLPQPSSTGEYDFELLSPFGVSFGKLENWPVWVMPGGTNEAFMYIDDPDFGIVLPEVRAAVITVMADEEEVTSGFTVNWYWGPGSAVLRTGPRIYGVTAGVALRYEIILESELAAIYRNPLGTHTVTNAPGNDTIIVRLEVRPEAARPVTITGRVVSEGQPVAGAEVFLTSTSPDDGTILYDYATTDANGYYEAEVFLGMRVNLFVDEFRYAVFNRIRAITQAGAIADIELVPSGSLSVALLMDYTYISLVSDDPITTPFFGTHHTQFTLRNKTRGTDIEDFSVTDTRLEIPFEYIWEFDVIEVTAVYVFDLTVTTEFTVLRTGSAAEISFIERGQIHASFSSVHNQNKIMIFDADGQFFTELFPQFLRTVTSGPLPDGPYSVIFMEYHTVFEGLRHLRDFEAINNLEEGKDYIKRQVSVRAGTVTFIEDVVIPRANLGGLYTDDAKSSVTVSKAQVAVGTPIAVRAEVHMQLRHTQDIVFDEILFDIPQGLQYVSGSASINGTYASAFMLDNVLRVRARSGYHQPSSSYILHFHVVPTEPGNHYIAASANVFERRTGQTYWQPFGGATLIAEQGALTINVPEQTGREWVLITGRADPSQRVSVYLNGERKANVQASIHGQWQATVWLENPYAYSFHTVYAEAVLDSGETVRSEVKTLIHNIAYPEIEQITMFHNTGSPNSAVATSTTFNFGPTAANRSWYSFNPTFGNMTFAITFNKPDADVSDVFVLTRQASGVITQIRMHKDPVRDLWVGHHNYNVFTMPIAIGARYTANGMEAVIDRNEAIDRVAALEALTAEHKEVFDEFFETEELTLPDGTKRINIISIDNPDERLMYDYKELNYADYAGWNAARFEDEGFVGAQTVDGIIYVKDLDENGENGVRAIIVDTAKQTAVYFSVSMEDAAAPVMFAAAMSSRSFVSALGRAGDWLRRVGGTRLTSDEINKAVNQNVSRAATGVGLGDSMISANSADGVLNAVSTAINNQRQLLSIQCEHGRPVIRTDYQLRAEGQLADLMLEFLNGPYDKYIQQFQTRMAADAFMTLICFVPPVGTVMGVAGGLISYHDGAKELNALQAAANRTIYRAIMIADNALSSGWIGCCPNEGFDRDGFFDDMMVNVPLNPAIDPSGYVYEAVWSNRLEGVKATIYQADDEHGANPQLWDAAYYDQENPLFTDREGYYAWDVPFGWWGVTYELSGYEIARSADRYGWLPVPPIQLDVHIGMVSKRVPTVESIFGYEDYIEIVFEKYMDTKTLTAANITLPGFGTGYNISFFDAEECPENDTKIFARIVRVSPISGKFTLGTTVNVAIAKEVECYAAVNMAANYFKATEIIPEPKSIEHPATVNLDFGKSKQITVSVLPLEAGKGKTITAVSNTPMIVAINPSVVTNNNGEATFTLSGELPGVAQITLKVDGVQVIGTIKVNVGIPSLSIILPSSECDVISVTAPAGAVINQVNRTITADVASGVANQDIAVTVSAGATWKLYNDAACTNEITNKTITLSGGANTVYIKVTAEDGVTTKIYTVTVNRATTVTTDIGGGGGTTTATSATLNVREAAFNKSAPSDITVTLTPGNRTFREIRNGNYTLVRDKDFTVTGNTYTIKAEYLATLDVGRVTLTFHMSGGTNPTLVITITGDGTAPTPTPIPEPDGDGVLINGEETALKLNADGSITVTADDFIGVTTPVLISIPFDGGDNNHTGVLKKDGQDIIIPYSVYKNGAMIMLITEPGTYGVISNKKIFTDTSGHWAAETIDFITARAIYSGVGDNRFDPNGGMTRAMFAQVLANIEGVNSTATTSRFTDVDNNLWYTAAVEWAASSGIVSGYGNGLFGPNDLITREQMAVMLMNYVNYKNYKLPSGATSQFNDEADMASWAYSAVKWVQAAGIVVGRPGNIYDPKATATRAEVATIFSNFINIFVEYTLNTEENRPASALSYNSTMDMYIDRSAAEAIERALTGR